MEEELRQMMQTMDTLPQHDYAFSDSSRYWVIDVDTPQPSDHQDYPLQGWYHGGLSKPEESFFKDVKKYYKDLEKKKVETLSRNEKSKKKKSSAFSIQESVEEEVDMMDVEIDEGEEKPTQLKSTSSSAVDTTSISSQQAKDISLRSSLTKSMHNEYLNLCEKQKFSNPKFLLLDKLVKEEQEAYREYYLNFANQEAIKYSFIHPQVLQLMEERIAAKKQRVLSFPVQYFRSILDIPLSCPLIDTKLCLIFEKTILYWGVCREFKIEQFKQRKTSDYIAIPAYKPSIFANTEKSDTAWTKTSYPSVSEDALITSFWQTNLFSTPPLHNVDFVFSSSSIQTLFDNHSDFAQEWCIPLQLRMCNGKQVAFLDKPFIGKAITMKERNRIYYRYCLQSEYTNMDPHSLAINFDRLNNRTSNQAQDNLTYNTWLLGGLRLLIRSKIPSFVSDSKHKNKQKAKQVATKFVGIQCKIEYMLQPNKLERETKSELARWWLYTSLKPDNGHLIVARIYPNRNQVVGIDRTEAKNLMGQFESAELLNRFYMILKSIQMQIPNLTEGTYLLRHEKNATSATLLQAAEQQFCNYNLYEDYKNAGAVDSTIPYVPVAENNPRKIEDTFDFKK